MLNRDIYQKDPSTRKLVNEGVASVNDEKTNQALSVLRYELESFVCDGQYEKGLEHILDVYLKNIEQAEQPAVWVSGFYGSGKSHLVKMLRALWVDSQFEDGATARGIANLPQGVGDYLKELSTQAKRHGGLHAASGTLGSSSRDKSVRMALLGILFKSVGLPEQYPVARFVMWLQHEGIYEAVRSHVETNGFDWNEELDNFYVAEGLHEALVKAKPNLFTSPASCVETLNNLYSKRIDEKRSSNKRGPNGNRWLYPDLVGMEDLGTDWHQEVKDCVSQYSDKRTKLWSFEVKLLINRSNVRECFFQSVSNSSWSNFGYLVAAEIEGQDTLKELRMLFAAHGIGLIKLEVENPSESQVLIPAKERGEIDWDTRPTAVRKARMAGPIFWPDPGHWASPRHACASRSSQKTIPSAASLWINYWVR